MDIFTKQILPMIVEPIEGRQVQNQYQTNTVNFRRN